MCHAETEVGYLTCYFLVVFVVIVVCFKAGSSPHLLSQIPVVGVLHEWSERRVLQGERPTFLFPCLGFFFCRCDYIIRQTGKVFLVGYVHRKGVLLCQYVHLVLVRERTQLFRYFSVFLFVRSGKQSSRTNETFVGFVQKRSLFCRQRNIVSSVINAFHFGKQLRIHVEIVSVCSQCRNDFHVDLLETLGSKTLVKVEEHA